MSEWRGRDAASRRSFIDPFLEGARTHALMSTTSDRTHAHSLSFYTLFNDFLPRFSHTFFSGFDRECSLA